MKFTKEEIEARKAKSKERFEHLKQRTKELQKILKEQKAKNHQRRLLQQQQVREGLDFLKDKEFLTTKWEIEGGFTITTGYVVNHYYVSNKSVIYASYCIKAPDDKYSAKTACGLIGSRIASYDDWAIEIDVPIETTGDSNLIFTVLKNKINNRIIIRSPEVPNRLIKYLFGKTDSEWRAQQKEKVLDAKMENLGLDPDAELL